VRVNASTGIEVCASSLVGHHDYIRAMNTGPLIAEIAALAGDPARGTILAALLDGRALTAGELAYAARITPQTASAHLARLAEANLISVLKRGRFRYFRLASPRVATMLEAIMAVAVEHRPRFRPFSPEQRRLRSARVCYDHLAGQLGVALADSLAEREFVILDEEGGHITEAGNHFLAEFGIDLSATRHRRHICRACIDWTERRPHIGGALGAALAHRCFELGWTQREKHSRAVTITDAGERGLHETFGIAPIEATVREAA
jgi:DNA-binding transcriptional ArsR family regulator